MILNIDNTRFDPKKPVTLYSANDPITTPGMYLAKSDHILVVDPAQSQLDKEAEELRKLEEEVAQLTKDAEANVQKPPIDNLGEISVIDEQTVMVNGKLKRKKRKKKKRKKLGGGEETIANITIDEVDIDETPLETVPEEKKDIKLNPPPKKKKVKKHKNKPTPLGVVEEDSKEISMVTDILRSGTLDSNKFTNGSDNTSERRSLKDHHTGNTVVPVKSRKSRFSEHKIEQVNPIESPKNEKKPWKFPEDEGMPVNFSDVDSESRKESIHNLPINKPEVSSTT